MVRRKNVGLIFTSDADYSGDIGCIYVPDVYPVNTYIKSNWRSVFDVGIKGSMNRSLRINGIGNIPSTDRLSIYSREDNLALLLTDVFIPHSVAIFSPNRTCLRIVIEEFNELGLEYDPSRVSGFPRKN